MALLNEYLQKLQEIENLVDNPEIKIFFVINDDYNVRSSENDWQTRAGRLTETSTAGYKQRSSCILQ